MRVVSTACSNTEIVCALGCADLLVGVDDHSDYPEDVVQDLPRVGPDLGVDPEKVLALEPDLVLASLTVPGHEKVVEALEQTGLRVVAPEPVSLADVRRDIAQIGDLLGVPDRAAALAAELELEASDPPPVPPKILVEWWPKPVIAPGEQSWVTQLIELAGGVNPLASDPSKSRPLSNEEVAEIDPDAIVISWCGVHPSKYRPDVVLDRPETGETRAVREGHVFCIAEAHLGRPGPRLVDGLRDLRQVVQKVARLG
ncbi:MAG: helical backbone metal receptor [Acidobacteriota bacterium]